MSIKLVYNPFFFQSLRLSKHILGSKYFTNSNTVYRNKIKTVLEIYLELFLAKISSIKIFKLLRAIVAKTKCPSDPL